MERFLGTEKEYRAHPALSQSDLRHILKSPLHYANREKLQRNSEAMQFGTAAHMALLEPMKFKELYLTEPTAMPNGEAINRRKKADKEFLEDFRLKNLDKVVIEEDDLDCITGILNSLLTNETAAMLLTGGEPEIAACWEYRGHQCKGKLDKWHINHPLFGKTVVEFKTTQDASEAQFSREIINRGMDFQAAFYNIAFNADRYFIIACDKSAPYAHGIYDMELYLPLGKSKVDRAFDRLEECIKTNKWSGYTTNVNILRPPTWAVGLENEES